MDAAFSSFKHLHSACLPEEIVLRKNDRFVHRGMPHRRKQTVDCILSCSTAIFCLKLSVCYILRHFQGFSLRNCTCIKPNFSLYNVLSIPRMLLFYQEVSTYQTKQSKRTLTATKLYTRMNNYYTNYLQITHTNHPKTPALVQEWAV